MDLAKEVEKIDAVHLEYKNGDVDEKDEHWYNFNCVSKDVPRTFVSQPLFNNDLYGKLGTSQLEVSLKCYAMHNPDIGYCQSMNFIFGFLMLVNGADALEAFKFFTKFAETVEISENMDEHIQDANADAGVYPKYSFEKIYFPSFPLYQEFVWIFEQLLVEHMEDIEVPAPLWL